MIIAEFIDGEVVNREVPDVPLTAEELRVQRLAEIDGLKQQLASTDYKAIKFAEGWLTDEEFAGTRAQRQAWRDRINELESESEE